MRKMTREQAIRNYVEQLNGDDLTYLLQHMNGYDGCFEEATYYDMDEFDEFLSGRTPMEIAQMIFLGDERPPMGIWYDCEDEDCFADWVDTTALCSAFIVTCNEAGYSAGIYTSSLKCTDYMTNSIRPNLLADYVPYWIADYRGYNGFSQDYPDKHVAGWQYSDSEYIGDTNVDMNEWYEM
nr:GH25 family lysozyme [uncultured Megasphaera sp.]